MYFGDALLRNVIGNAGCCAPARSAYAAAASPRSV